MAYRTQIKSGGFKEQRLGPQCQVNRCQKNQKICQPAALHLSPQTPTVLALRGQHGLRPDGELDLPHSFLGICQKGTRLIHRHGHVVVMGDLVTCLDTNQNQQRTQERQWRPGLDVQPTKELEN